MDMLREGEHIILEEGASHYHQFIAVGGQIRLTNQRLLFCSKSSNCYYHDVAIELRDISGVEFFKTMMMSPNGLAVSLHAGQVEHFIVDDRKAWKERIAHASLQVA